MSEAKSMNRRLFRRKLTGVAASMAALVLGRSTATGETEKEVESKPKTKTRKSRYGFLVRNGAYSRRRGDWQDKDFEVGLSECGKFMRVCWTSDEEDGLPRRRQIHLSADPVRAMFDE